MLSIASAIAVFVILHQTIARRFRRSLGNSDIAFWLISQRILPPVAVVIPIYVLFQRLGLLDTLRALDHHVRGDEPADRRLADARLLRDASRSSSRSPRPSTARRATGSSAPSCCRSSVPGLVATFLFVLVFAWNEYLLALFLSSANAQTMPLTVAAQNATRGPQWWYMSVLILIMIAPVIVDGDRPRALHLAGHARRRRQGHEG